MSNLKQFQSFAKRNKLKAINNNKAVIYTRVSDVKQHDNTSLESQKKYCTEFANKKEFEICEYFGGTHESAKTDDRKEFQRLLTYVRQRKISNIIVYSIDRFSRAGASAIATVEQLSKKGINVLSVTQPVNTDTSTGTFFQNINLLFSKYDNDQRREKTITGMRQRLLNGYWMGVAPIGYKNARNEQNIPIIVKDEKAKFVKKAFMWKLNEEISNAEIIERLKLLGFIIYRQRLTAMFKNPVYCGLISHSLLEGEIVKGNHPAIISEKVFLEVNGIQAKNSQGYKQNKSNENLPLKGFMKCKGCGSPLTGYLVRKKGLYYYKCKTTGCSCNRSTKAIHEQFEDVLAKYQIDDKLVAPLKTQLQYTFEHYNKTDKDLVATLKYNLKGIDEKIEKVEERYVIGEINGELYNKFVHKFKKEKEDTEAEIQKSSLESSNLNYYIDESLNLFTKLNNIWSSSDYSSKQKLQNVLFPDGIVYDRQNDEVRTPRINLVMELVRCLSMSFVDKKRGQTVNFNNLSSSVSAQGFEPWTASLEGRCSIQLSYAPLVGTNLGIII